MISGYSIDIGRNADEIDDQPTLPNNEAEFYSAKTFLQTASLNTGDNLYDHLSEVLNKILAERPQNVIDFFEEYSRKVKEQRYRPLTDHLEDMYITPASFKLASKMMTSLKPLADLPPSTVDPDDLETVDMSKNNLLEMLFYLEQAGLGLPRQEMAFIMLSMRQLIAEKPISSIKFWGKILGRFNNYLILETELKEEEYMKRNEAFADQKQFEMQALEASAGVDDLDKALKSISAREGESEADPGYIKPRTLPLLPKIQYQEPKDPPEEVSGTGLNKKTYFVCTEVGGPWIELPDITPKQIRVSRQIYKSFTGNLEAEILTYPEFPGTEKNYLRAQIARISSGTQIAPLGYFTFGGQELGEGADDDELGEEAAGGENRSSYKINPKYDPPALKDLLDSSMSFWVHTAPYILPQGRVSWWNPGIEDEMPEDEELGEELGEEEEDDKRVTKAEPETGPPLLTPLSEDASLETTTPWTARPTSSVIDMYSLAVLRSNLWPGGYAVSTPGKNFYNLYVGFGLKYMQHNFSPLPLPPVQQEYALGPEILEVLDPTGMDEEQWRIDHLPKLKPMVGEGGEEAEPEQEEEDEEEEEED